MSPSWTLKMFPNSEKLTEKVNCPHVHEQACENWLVYISGDCVFTIYFKIHEVVRFNMTHYCSAGSAGIDHCFYSHRNQ